MREEFKLKDLKQLKELLNRLDENKPLVFKTIDNKELEFYGIYMGGTVTAEGKSETIPQGLVFKLIKE